MEAHGRWLRSDDAKPSYTTDCVVVAVHKSGVVNRTGEVLNFIKHTGLHKRGLTINNIDNYIIYFHIWHMTNLEF